jgi:TetR/AcrR family transcriptional regulator
MTRQMKAATRDPERSRTRILKAALQEFAARGLAGARVDTIARRARINKRMLYHYFGDKAALFRAILRLKLAETQGLVVATPDDPGERLAFWLDLVARDVDWVRLLEWEALEARDGAIVEEDARREAFEQVLARLRTLQERGVLSDTEDAGHMLLSMIALTTFPLAFPQLTRLITGLSPHEAKFTEARAAFLREFGRAFRPVSARRADAEGPRVLAERPKADGPGAPPRVRAPRTALGASRTALRRPATGHAR